jgi:phage tail-like protein
MAKQDPYRNYDFKLELGSVIDAAFAEVTGAGSTTDVIEYREGGDNHSARKLPGLTKPGNLTLKRGITNSTALFDWYAKIVAGDIDRRECAIILLDPQGNPVVRWNVTKAWPTRLAGPDLNAKGTDVAIETLELVCEGVVRVAAS